MMEDNQLPEIQEDLGAGGKFKNWLQDNIRIIISVLIVFAIAGGIYSYSRRGEVSTTEEEIALEETTTDEKAVAVIDEDEEVTTPDAEKDEEATTPDAEEDKEATTPDAEEDKSIEKEPEQEKTTEEQVAEKDTATITPVAEEKKTESISEETEEAFIEVAVSGDSQTTLARKALKNYLEKNQDSSLTAEHKIYIEDYLRKNIQHSGVVEIGESLSFSKVLIKDAIEKAKTLNEDQLNNLKKYSARVSNL